MKNLGYLSSPTGVEKQEMRKRKKRTHWRPHVGDDGDCQKDDLEFRSKRRRK